MPSSPPDSHAATPRPADRCTGKGQPQVSYLRLSITDRCDLRCIYCMPADGVPKLEHGQVLRYEDLVTIVRAAVAEGVTRVRVTGGEPLIRRGVVEFIAELARIEGIADLSLTTNGTRLAELAGSLHDAGLRRVNVSLDSLDPEKYHRITRCGRLDRVVAGIDAALAAGLAPVKVNCVVMAGVNDDEVLAMARLALDRPLHVRFIERMPFNQEPGRKGGDWPLAGPDPDGTRTAPSAPATIGAADASVGGRDGAQAPNQVVGRAEMLSRLASLQLSPVADPEQALGGGPAEMFAPAGGRGLIGLISPNTCPFCVRCNRLRVTAAGELKPCLKSATAISLRGLTEPEIRAAIRRAVGEKGDLQSTPGEFVGTTRVSLSDIGG